MKKIKFQIPGTKSLANRALILASLTKGTSCLKNIPKGEDVEYMIKNLQNLGISIKKISKKEITIKGGNFLLKKKYFYIGNAGTTGRFLTALLSTIPGKKILDGDSRMRKRPIKDLVDALNQIGAKISYQKKQGFLPLEIEGTRLRGGKVKIKADISSQYLSALLMISPTAEKPVKIEVMEKITSEPYIKLTLDLMKKFGIKTEKIKNTFFIKPQAYRAAHYKIESDCAAASYFEGIGFLHKKTLRGKKIHFEFSPKTKQGEYRFFHAIKKLEAKKEKEKETKIDGNAFPDSAMTIAVLAGISKGITKLTNIKNLAIKETDRLSALQKELKRLGILVKKTKNSLKIFGNPELKILKPIKIKTYNDHRMAMSFAVLKSRFPNIQIENPSCVKKSYPDFWKDYRKFLILMGKNIALTGMRGSGKTTLGRKIAAELGYQFIDTDEEIQKKIRMTIEQFIKKNGLEKFREIEKKIIKKISEKTHCVIATGGGVIINPENEKFLKKKTWIIYLKCPVSLLIERLKKDPKKDQRPSLTKKPLKKEIQKLYKERKKRYEESADLSINSHEADAKKILKKLFPER